MAVLRNLVVWVAVGLAVPAHAAPPAAEKLKQATQFAADEELDKALVVIDEGLATAPKDIALLGLKGTVLLKLRDYAGALAAYQAYLDAGVRGGNRREAQKIVNLLRAAKSTSINVTLTNGPGKVYLDSKSQGVFCEAAPTCNRALLPGDYKVIVERDGFDRFTQKLAVAAGGVAQLEVTLVEKPSLVTVRAATSTGVAGSILLDGAPYEEPTAVAAGTHEVIAGKVGFGTVRRKVVAAAGAPIELDLTLHPLVPIDVEPRGLELRVDDVVVEIEDGGVPVPPGEHVLVGRAPGFHDRKVAIGAGRGADLRIEMVLPPVGAMLSLANAPRGAQVVIDGKVLGTAPLAAPVEIPPGMRVIELRMDGFRPVRVRDRFVTDQVVKLEVGALRLDSRKRTYLAGAASAAFLIAGGVFSYAALDREAAYNDRARLAGVTSTDSQLADMRKSGERYSLFADVGLGLGLVGLGATTYFFLHEGRGESAGGLTFGVGPASAMVSAKF